MSSPGTTRRLLAGALGLALGLLGGPAAAHDPDVATFVLRPVAAERDGATARGWVLDLHAPRAAVDRAVPDRPQASNAAGAARPSVAWRERVVAYLRSHVRITRDGTPVAFGGGGIKVGGHQTDARFWLPDVPPAGARLTVVIDAFTEDGHQSNVLRLRGARPRTVVLDADNAYTAEVEPAR